MENKQKSLDIFEFHRIEMLKRAKMWLNNGNIERIRFWQMKFQLDALTASIWYLQKYLCCGTLEKVNYLHLIRVS